MTLRLLCLGAPLVVAATAATAHADDLQVWTAAGASLMPVDRLEVKVEPQIRFDESGSRFSAVLVDTGLRYRVAQWLRLGVGYRPEYERDGGDEELRHRLNADVGVRADLDAVRIGYRLRLQEQIRPGSGDQYRATLRNLLGISYRGWKRWTPELSAELFHASGDVDGFELDKVRLTLGVTCEIKKRQDLEVFYRVERPENDPTALTQHMVGLTYHYDLYRQ